MGLLQERGSYYGVLGVNRDSSIREIRSAYRRLAMIWHPDRWCRTPSQSEEAKRRFQQIQEAYEVLSDQRRRTLYDAGLYFPDEEEDEGFSEFLQEMLSLMADVGSEGRGCTVGELQRAFQDLVQEFEFSQPPNMEEFRTVKRPRCDGGPTDAIDSGVYHASNLWKHGFCK
ncbi:hypothetical protein H6P81_008948 [Aristolochia fimbriata]|uniref:J domain-containing protein n=1 Tax=Aristolochia fimbriata TaxID=158543 RepID=A0AAV7EP05_ARIFI|nr:hypothetical protein H6P81_008948 [Aristolochia fimbriata]